MVCLRGLAHSPVAGVDLTIWIASLGDAVDDGVLLTVRCRRLEKPRCLESVDDTRQIRSLRSLSLGSAMPLLDCMMAAQRQREIRRTLCVRVCVWRWRTYGALGARDWARSLVGIRATATACVVRTQGGIGYRECCSTASTARWWLAVVTLGDRELALGLGEVDRHHGGDARSRTLGGRRGCARCRGV